MGPVRELPTQEAPRANPACGIGPRLPEGLSALRASYHSQRGGGLGGRARGNGGRDARGPVRPAARAKNVYDMDRDFRLNLAAAYDIGENLTCSALVLNLLSANDAKRYSYDAGVSSAAPHRIAWVEEAWAVGAKVSYRF
jgi:hypothetical protein